MSRPHGGHRPFFPFGNPFRMILPKGSHVSSKLHALLDSFEEILAARFKKLQRKESSDFLSLSWMREAMESLSETHTDINCLITDLQFPVSDWDKKWMDMYLDNSVKLLDICIALSSELSRIDQGHLFLQYVQHVLDPSSGPPSQEQLKQACGSLQDWMQQINLRNSRLKNSSSILQSLADSLDLQKVKNSTKGKVLMQAMYGVKVHTVFVCSVFTAALSGSSNALKDLHVSEKFVWAEAFNQLKSDVNGVIRRLFSSGRFVILKELWEVDQCVQNLLMLTDSCNYAAEYSMQIDGKSDLEKLHEIANVEREDRALATQICVLKLNESAQALMRGLDHLTKQVGDFFQIVLSGRDALLCNLRVPDMQDSLVEERCMGDKFHVSHNAV